MAGTKEHARAQTMQTEAWQTAHANWLEACRHLREAERQDRDADTKETRRNLREAKRAEKEAGQAVLALLDI